MINQINLYEIRNKINYFLEKGVLDARVIDALRFQDGLLPKECELWDYKRQGSKDALPAAKTTLQIVSFYNTYGGFIIYGVEEQAVGQPLKPVGVKPNSLDVKQLTELIKNSTGEMIDISYVEVLVDFQNVNFMLGILQIPKRNKSKEPVFFGKNGPANEKGKFVFNKDEAYLRCQDSCKPAKTKEELQMLFGERINSFLWDPNSGNSFTSTRPVILDNNLPDRNFICPKFIGRDSIIESLWKWLGDEFVHTKVLAGEGGKGKTSIAYEFAEEICRVRPYDIEKVIWLTAKKKQFVGIYDRYVTMPETHFSDTESLLRALCSELAILDSESDGGSIQFLKKLLKKAMAELPSLVIIDDVDSTELDEQKMILETAMQLSNSKSRFLLTTRMNFAFSRAASIRVSGLVKNDYQSFIIDLIASLKCPKLKQREIDELRRVTDGSPLFTESIMRLYRSGIALNVVIKQWQGKLGSEVRKAALTHEIESLSGESRRILLACAYMREASVTELKQVTGYSDDRMQGCLAELEALFLVSSPEFIKKERRFAVTNNTATLVLENAQSLVHDPVGIQKLVAKLRSRSSEKEKLPRVGGAIKQALALINDGSNVDALATIDSALEEEKNNPDLLIMRARCLFISYKENGQSSYLDSARKAFRYAYTKGAKKEPLFSLWYESEVLALNPAGALDVASVSIEQNIIPRHEWFKRRAEALFLCSRAHEQAFNLEAGLEEMKNATDDIHRSISLSKEYERVPLVDLWFQLNDEVWRIYHLMPWEVWRIRDSFDFIHNSIKHGDDRVVSYARLLSCVEDLYKLYKTRLKLKESQKNQLEELVRISGEVLRNKHNSKLSGMDYKKLVIIWNSLSLETDKLIKY